MLNEVHEFVVGSYKVRASRKTALYGLHVIGTQANSRLYSKPNKY